MGDGRLDKRNIVMLGFLIAVAIFVGAIVNTVSRYPPGGIPYVDIQVWIFYCLVLIVISLLSLTTLILLLILKLGSYQDKMLKAKRKEELNQKASPPKLEIPKEPKKSRKKEPEKPVESGERKAEKEEPIRTPKEWEQEEFE